MALTQIIKEKNTKLQLVKQQDELFIVSIGEIFDSLQLGMSDIQIEKFVLNDFDFPTEWGKYKQSKLELWVRFQAIVTQYFEYEKLLAEIELLEAEIDELKSIGDRISLAKARVKEIEIEQRKFRLEVIKKTIMDKLREARAFYRTFSKLKDKFENLTEEKIRELELEFWREKAKFDPTGKLKAYLGIEPTEYPRI